MNLNNIKIGIIGLGYVGLPLAVEFGKKYSTIGYDIDKNRVVDLKSNFDKTMEVSNNELKDSNVLFTSKINELKHCNVFIITVPTPVDHQNNPDLLPLKNASSEIGKLLKAGDTVIYESTVYPGATEEICVPILSRESGLQYNEDFFCGYSPERINPGDKSKKLTSIKKITSGSNEDSASFVDKLYSSIIHAGTHKAFSIKVCEAAKIIENIQRDVNIALINEFAMLFQELGLDTTEILNAASTKWNFLPFSPGLVGGHCIGVDPYYLAYKAKEIGYDPQIILAGRRINEKMSEYIANKAIIELTKSKINPIGSNIAIMGVTFKENCPDIRNTKVLGIINILIKYGCNVYVTDNCVDKNEFLKKHNLKIKNFEELKNIDLTILAVSHNEYHDIPTTKFEKIFRNNGILLDIKSVYSIEKFKKSSIKHWRL